MCICTTGLLILLERHHQLNCLLLYWGWQVSVRSDIKTHFFFFHFDFVRWLVCFPRRIESNLGVKFGIFSLTRKLIDETGWFKGTRSISIGFILTSPATKKKIINRESINQWTHFFFLSPSSKKKWALLSRYLSMLEPQPLEAMYKKNFFFILFSFLLAFFSFFFFSSLFASSWADRSRELCLICYS